MRIRAGFVSNSSSSSFVILSKIPLTWIDELSGARLYELSTPGIRLLVMKRMLENIGVEFTPGNVEDRHFADFPYMYLTCFISDSYDIIHDQNSRLVYPYTAGDHGGPYHEEDYICLSEDELTGVSVWILKEDMII